MLNTMGYDAVRLVAEAIKDGGEGGPEIKDALYKIKNFPGVTGDITFDKNGDVIYRPIGVKIVKEARFQEFELN